VVLTLLVDFVELELEVLTEASDDVFFKLVDRELLVVPKAGLLVGPLTQGSLARGLLRGAGGLHLDGTGRGCWGA